MLTVCQKRHTTQARNSFVAPRAGAWRAPAIPSTPGSGCSRQRFRTPNNALLTDVALATLRATWQNAKRLSAEVPFVSYDLYFRFRAIASSLSVDAFRDYFRSRKHYALNEHDQAWYENADTGTYFVFEYGHRELDAEEDDEEFRPPVDSAPVAFNINFFRPHTFAFEAGEELQHFVQTFDLRVDDPQDAMIDGEFSLAAFIQGWSKGNEFGYRAILSSKEAERPLTLRREVLEACWRWNTQRDALQERYDECDVFVPKVMFLREDQLVRTAVVWGDGVAIAVPYVDRIIVPRKALAPFRLFGKREDTVLLSWDEAAPLLSQFPRLEHGGMPFHLLDYDSPPPVIVNFVKRKSAFGGQLQGIAADSVLTAELLEKALGEVGGG
jgi:hypothetical protein